MIQFEFTSPVRIRFGPGTIKEVGSAAAQMGRRALVVTGLQAERTQQLLDLLKDAGVEASIYQVHGEPTVDDPRLAAVLAAEEACELVIGFGGGSAIDTGKAAAALLANPGDVYDYLEVIGRGQAITNVPAPYIAIPTTAGTGAEVTRNAVLSAPEQKVKVSMRSPLMLPRLALVDPELTSSLPPSVTASTGLDAITQLIEPYVSTRANPLTDALCREGLRRAAWALPQAYRQGDDLAARSDMSLASLFGGLALANAGLGAVHGFAAPLGGFVDAPHGAICAILLPAVMEANLRALRQRSSQSPQLVRYAQIAEILTGRSGASADEGVEWIQGLVVSLKIPALSTYGLSESDLPILIEKATEASSMKTNPIRLQPEELLEILEKSLTSQ
jgi:alcohol dehydrogenase class IV